MVGGSQSEAEEAFRAIMTLSNFPIKTSLIYLLYFQNQYKIKRGIF